MVAAIGGGGVLIKERIGKRGGGGKGEGEKTLTEGEEEGGEEETREELLELRMVELSRLSTTTIEEARARHEEERGIWKEREEMAQAQHREALAALESEGERERAKERGRREEAAAAARQRENELVGSLVELEAGNRRLKREKKVLVLEIKSSRKEREGAEMRLRGEAAEAKMMFLSLKKEKDLLSGLPASAVEPPPASSPLSPLAQLKDRHVKLLAVLERDPGNEELRVLCETIGRAVEGEEEKGRLKFVR